MPKSAFTDAYETFVDILVAARLELDLKQDQLAKRLGVTQPWVSNYERRVRRLDVIEFYAIARAMRCDPVELFQRVVKALPKNVDIT